ncbi:MAG: DUF1634 domain-containing protein [Chloroflexota bacterium]|nr:DUF1634 domain-containing protein [Chloroflexota bacterium]
MTDRLDDRLKELGPVYRIAGFTLAWGFRCGAMLLAVGLILAAIRNDPLNRTATPFSEIFPAIRDGEASGLIDLAILILIMTPVATTLAVAAGFARLRDSLYTILSLWVLTILGVSIGLALLR